MVAQLVTRNFRRASGTLARGITVLVTLRDTATVVDSVVTDNLGFASVYLEPDQYDWVGSDPVFRIPFDVLAQSIVEPAPPFVHSQPTPAATWTILHNRGSKPPVVLELDSFPDELVYTDVSYPDLNTVVVEWPSAESGKAYIP